MWNPHFGSCKHVVDGSILHPYHIFLHRYWYLLWSYIVFIFSWIALWSTCCTDWSQKITQAAAARLLSTKITHVGGSWEEAPWEKSWQEGNLWQLPVEYTDRKWINKISWIEFNPWDTEVFLWLFDCCFFQYPPCFSNKDKKGHKIEICIHSNI